MAVVVTGADRACGCLTRVVLRLVDHDLGGALSGAPELMRASELGG